MDDALAHKRLSEVLDLIDRYDQTYDMRWGHGGFVKNLSLDRELRELPAWFCGRCGGDCLGRGPCHQRRNALPAS